MDHHLWWKSVTKLDVADYGVEEHASGLEALQIAMERDQVDPVNLMCFQKIKRRCQMIEWFHSERFTWSRGCVKNVLNFLFAPA